LVLVEGVRDGGGVATFLFLFFFCPPRAARGRAVVREMPACRSQSTGNQAMPNGKGGKGPIRDKKEDKPLAGVCATCRRLRAEYRQKKAVAPMESSARVFYLYHDVCMQSL